MPKVDINAALKSPTMNSKSRRKSAGEATTALLQGGILMLDQQPNVAVQEIPLEQIQLRSVNRFHEIENIELDESIRQFGLINPIAVCHHEGEQIYTISAGERRYKAIKRLHERYPQVEKFKTIECKVYILTEDPTLLAYGFPYISKEQEEGIYRDSNMQTRQLSNEDIAGQIRHIVDRFNDPAYVESLKEAAAQAGFKTYKQPDRAKLISSVLRTQNLWSNEKIRQYLIIYDSKNEDMLDAIERGEKSVSACYKKIVEDQKRKRNRSTNRLPSFLKNMQKLKLEADNRKYSPSEIKQLQKCIDELQKIIDNN